MVQNTAEAEAREILQHFLPRTVEFHPSSCGCCLGSNSMCMRMYTTSCIILAIFSVSLSLPLSLRNPEVLVFWDLVRPGPHLEPVLAKLVHHHGLHFPFLLLTSTRLLELQSFAQQMFVQDL